MSLTWTHLIWKPHVYNIFHDECPFLTQKQQWSSNCQVYDEVYVPECTSCDWHILYCISNNNNAREVCLCLLLHWSHKQRHNAQKKERWSHTHRQKKAQTCAVCMLHGRPGAVKLRQMLNRPFGWIRRLHMLQSHSETDTDAARSSHM